MHAENVRIAASAQRIPLLAFPGQHQGTAAKFGLGGIDRPILLNFQHTVLWRARL